MSTKPKVEKVAFTMYSVTDPARARDFYENKLGLQVGMHGSQGDMHWIEYDLPGGGCLALTNATGEKPGVGGTIAFEVADLDALVSELKAKGVEFRGELVKGPRCRMANCIDSEGNAIVLHQLDDK
ncbi:MAG TPA: VOC family protein [Polyangiaceae bacterium]